MSETLCECGCTKDERARLCKRCDGIRRSTETRGLERSKLRRRTKLITTRRIIRGRNDYTPGRYADIAYYRPPIDGYWERIEEEVKG